VAYTTTADVEVRLMRPLTAAESAAAGAWIDDLEAEIAQRIPDVDALIVLGTVREAAVRRVVSQAVIRVLRNPEGLRTVTTGIDDATETRTVDGSLSSGALFLTSDEWDLILPSAAGDAFTIRPFGAA
jgi:hypothetical protein